MKNSKKYLAGIATFILTCSLMTTVFAVTLNIDFLSIAREYLNTIQAENATKANQRLDAKKNAISKDILNYVEKYKKDISSQLDAYTEEEIKKAENDLSAYSTDVKAQLDANKQPLIDEYKSKIKTDVAAQKGIKEKELQKSIEDGIKDIFKGR
jgi:hypothetical protein